MIVFFLSVQASIKSTEKKPQTSETFTQHSNSCKNRDSLQNIDNDKNTKFAPSQSS